MRRNPLLAIFTTVFIDLVGFGILIPVFPLLIGVGSPFRVTPESWSFTKGLIMLGWSSISAFNFRNLYWIRVVRYRY